MESGKLDLIKILQGSENNGRLERYMTGDGRSLDWVYELEVLAFCKPCLKLMMRHKEASLSLRSQF